MTERRFEYDEGLLKRCARSNAARSVAAVSAEHSTLNNKFPRLVLAAGAGDVVSNPKQPSAASSAAGRDDDDASCVQLFQLHSQHYGRRHSPEESLLLLLQEVADEHHPYYQIGSRMEAFLRSVVFIDEHNSAVRAADDPDEHNEQHSVGLNRFSDLAPDQVFSPSEDTAVEEEEHHLLWSESSRRHRRRQLEEQDYAVGLDWSSGPAAVAALRKEGVTVLLSTPEQILDVAANLTIGKGSLNRLYNYNKEKKENSINYDLFPTSIDIPTIGQEQGDSFASTPELTPDMDGALLSIKRNKHAFKHPTKKQYHDPVGDKDGDEGKERFTTHLNWATTDNPDGVPIVHGAFDQVGC